MITEKAKIRKAANKEQFNAWLDGQRDCKEGVPERSADSKERDWYCRGYGFEYEMQEILSNINGALK
jgi:hypothetical protein